MYLIVSSNSFFSFVAIARSASVAGFTAFTDEVDFADSREIFRFAESEELTFEPLDDVDLLRFISSFSLFTSSDSRDFSSAKTVDTGISSWLRGVRVEQASMLGTLSSSRLPKISVRS